MKKIIFSILILVLLVGCTVPEQPTTEERTEQTTEEATAKEPEIIEEKGLIVDKLKFQEGEIRKNKLTKTAEMEVNIPIEEEALALGTDFTTKFMCGLLSMSYFNQSAIEEWNREIEEMNKGVGVTEEEKEELQEKDEALDLIEGYKLTKVFLTLTLNETNEKIADCTITGYGEDDIKITIYKEYEANLFGEE